MELKEERTAGGRSRVFPTPLLRWRLSQLSTNGSKAASHLEPLSKHMSSCVISLRKSKADASHERANWTMGFSVFFGLGVKSAENDMDVNTADASAESSR